MIKQCGEGICNIVTTVNRRRAVRSCVHTVVQIVLSLSKYEVCEINTREEAKDNEIHTNSPGRKTV